MFYEWAPYVPVAERRKNAAAAMARLAKKGHPVSPVVITGRAIATTVWGKAWCTHLEAYSDYANRLPRGRTYARNGSVVDLQVAPGRIAAHISGSSMYRVTITIAPLKKTAWAQLCTACAGGIDSLVELLQGHFAAAVMERLCHQDDGLFPSPKQIRVECSCPDGSYLCKHAAAVLYGVGARLDHQPELLFTLRQTNPTDLLAQAGVGLLAKTTGPGSGRTLAVAEVGALFGLEMEADVSTPPAGQGGQKRSGLVMKVAAKTVKPSAPAAASVSVTRQKPAQDPSARLLRLLQRSQVLTCAEAQVALGWKAVIVRALLRQLVVNGHATMRGKTRGTTYHAVG